VSPTTGDRGASGGDRRHSSKGRPPRWGDGIRALAFYRHNDYPYKVTTNKPRNENRATPQRRFETRQLLALDAIAALRSMQFSRHDRHGSHTRVSFLEQLREGSE
jgi:hypothetical protein